MFLMLLVFAIGVERTESTVGCTVASVLIQYFTLASVFWMGAEAVLMFKKLIIVFGRISTTFIVVISLICWGMHKHVSTVLCICMCLLKTLCSIIIGVPVVFPIVGLTTLASGNNFLIRETRYSQSPKVDKTVKNVHFWMISSMAPALACLCGLVQRPAREWGWLCWH